MDVHPCFIILVSQPNRKLCQCHTYPISPSVEGAVLRTAQLRVYAAVHTADYIRRLDSNTHSGWWFGTWLLFFHILGIIFPTDELHHFSEGWLNHQPALIGSFFVLSLQRHMYRKIERYFFWVHPSIQSISKMGREPIGRLRPISIAILVDAYGVWHHVWHPPVSSNVAGWKIQL